MSIMEASPTRESDLFKGVSGRVMAEIMKRSEKVTCDRGATIISAGEEAFYIYELLEGNVELIVAEDEGGHVSMREAGQIFGWSALVEPYYYTATARATTPAKVMKISRDTIEKLAEEHPVEGLTIFRNLTRIIAGRLRTAYEYIYYIRGSVHPLMETHLRSL